MSCQCVVEELLAPVRRIGGESVGPCMWTDERTNERPGKWQHLLSKLEKLFCSAMSSTSSVCLIDPYYRQLTSEREAAGKVECKTVSGVHFIFGPVSE